MPPTHAQLLAGIRHVVHDYANLVSSGTMKLTDTHLGKPLDPPVNTHVGEVFLLNCRKMYEFFNYPQYVGKNPSGDDLGASLYLPHVSPALAFNLNTWDAWHQRMNKRLLHVTYVRDIPPPWEGHRENPLFLDEFKTAWKLMLSNLVDPFKSQFEADIAARLTSEYSGLDLR